ncbi:hypothetical protein K469DRAFT_727905 [Zopfia rhizophila CBS 207.26]|uniref:Uncharacterized protein n=1 Tax=Zopfia rhizophila CBS 207.26 TaxID=1314779 RepID=A0A6A6E128_9PEZI|nr:hypothetical protein K469DRAFT_727905 [Zopfia rhizophila CBS 207.26]
MLSNIENTEKLQYLHNTLKHKFAGTGSEQARVVLQRHNSQFTTHKVFTFLMFNMLVRYRNHQVSIMSVMRKEFPEIECIMQLLSAQRLEKAKDELHASGKTGNSAIKQLLRSLLLYGFCQPILAAYQTQDPEEAKEFLTSLNISYKRIQLAISDPLSLALFFYRKISMFFKYYIRYFRAIETNKCGALHLHSLL